MTKVRKIQRERVDSTNVKSIGFEDGTLEIEFKTSGIYRYFGVPARMYADLLRADSAGKYFNVFIKPYFTFEKVA